MNQAIDKKSHKQSIRSRRMDNRKLWRKRTFLQKAAALILAVVLTISPFGGWISGMFVQAAEFQIEMLQKGSMLADYNFNFFNVKVGTGIFYWIKSDGSPLFCIQKDRPLLGGLGGSESSEEFGGRRYFSDQQYELISLVLQSCGMRRGENQELTPGEYLAGQAAVWGIRTGYWQSTGQLREEMETLYAHVGDWNEWTADQLIEDARDMTESICQAIDDYYSDFSPYIPSFASKYSNKAPSWQAEWEDDLCQISFQLDGRAEAVKEFVYELPSGWEYQWADDEITFWSETAEPGTYSVSGYAPEGTRLGEAMPIGLIYIVAPSDYPSFQHLTSGVEITIPWSCYFKLVVPEKPDDSGSWQLADTSCYRHQEEFEAVYGVQLQKQDGDTGEALSGVVFQPLEYFDRAQLADTVLEPSQIAAWTGWQARCPEEITDEEGRLIHVDRKTYHYEKTYCGGHPEPEINYDGNSEARRAEIEEEAWAAWEAEVEACAERCDYHSIDGSGIEELEADRDLAYAQFTGLVYGYTFRETKPADGYQLPEEGVSTEKIFCVSLQAGGEAWEETGLQRSRNNRERAFASRITASPSSAGTSDAGAFSSGNSAAGMPAAGNSAFHDMTDGIIGDGVPASPAEARPDTGESGNSSSGVGQGTRTATPSLAKASRIRRPRAVVWLTSLLPVLSPESVDYSHLYTFSVDNFREKPEETKPEETTPEETTPEETTPEETTPEETTPEETMPEETTPEETMPEETTPEETLPVETTPEPTVPEETTPETTAPKETVPPETIPPQETTHRESSGGGGGRDREPAEVTAIPTEPVPLGPPRQGWIEAFYSLEDSDVPHADANGKNLPGPGEEGWRIPKTGDADAPERMLLIGILAGSGFLGIYLWMRKRNGKPEKKSRKKGGGELMVLGLLLVTGLACGTYTAYGAENAKTPIVETPIPQARSVSAEEQDFFTEREEDGTVLVRYFSETGDAEEEGEEGAFVPDEWYTDEYGQRYQLDFYRKVETEIPEEEEHQTRTIAFRQIENPAQIPSAIPSVLSDEANQREGRGTLERGETKEISSYWLDDFQASLTFYDYGADAYTFGTLSVPAENALEFLIGEQQSILEAMGCSPLRYQIREIAWEGDSYWKDGLLCRNASVQGSRLVSDYQAEFSGLIYYPSAVRKQWQAVYRIPQEELPEMEAETLQETTSGEIVAPVLETETPQKEEETSSGWKITRLMAVYTISLFLLLPFFLFLIFYAGKRRKHRPGN